MSKKLTNNILTGNYVLSEKDFYPPSDNRTFKTYIEESYRGEFTEFTEYIFDLYESEDYYENN